MTSPYLAESGESRRQLREIKLSGGFQSFDNPVAYFGLSDHVQVDAVEILWSDGARTHLDMPFPAQRRYLVRRLGPRSDRREAAN